MKIVKYKDYTVVSGGMYSEKFIEDVNALLLTGYVLIGGVSVCYDQSNNIRKFQAMAKPIEEKTFV